MDEDQKIETTAHDAPASEFPEAPRVAPTLSEELPGTKDKEFWGDAKHITANREDIEKQRQELFELNGKMHKPKIVGREFVCTSCPFEHTLPIDINKFTLGLNGAVIPIDSKAQVLA